MFPSANVVIRILLRSLSRSSRRTSQERIERVEEEEEENTFITSTFISIHMKRAAGASAAARDAAAVSDTADRDGSTDYLINPLIP